MLTGSCGNTCVGLKKLCPATPSKAKRQRRDREKLQTITLLASVQHAKTGNRAARPSSLSAAMDFLKAEIASKKRTLSPAEGSSSSQPANKYMRKGDLERMRREEEAKAEEARRQEQERKRQEKEAKLFARAKKVHSIVQIVARPSTVHTDIVSTLHQAAAAEHAAAIEAEAEAAGTSQDEDGKAKTVPSKPEAFNISNTEAIRRLRAKGQPIRLFGETDSERRLRLRAVELIEERSEGQQNAFMRAMENMDKGLALEELQKQAHGGHPALDRLKAGDREASSGPGSESEDGASPSEAKTSGDVYGDVQLELVKKDPKKVYPQIYYGIKRVLKEWEQSMADRPGK